MSTIVFVLSVIITLLISLHCIVRIKQNEWKKFIDSQIEAHKTNRDKYIKELGGRDKIYHSDFKVQELSEFDRHRWDVIRRCDTAIHELWIARTKFNKLFWFKQQYKDYV